MKPCTQHNANLLLQFAAFFASHTWTQQKMGRGGGFLEKFANPSNFFIEQTEKPKEKCCFQLIGKMAFMNTFLFRFCWYIRNRKLVMEKVVWSGFFERNKRVFSSAIRCMSLQKCYKQKKLLRKKKKENIGMWVSKQWWIFFKRQRQQQACFAHRTRERDRAAVGKKYIYRVDRNCATATLLIRAAAWSQVRSSLMPKAFWLCNFKTFK